MNNFDDLKLAVEALSGGKNTVILDDLGMPSIMVPFPKLKYSDIMSDGTEDTLPAFIVDGVEKSVIYESKFQNIVVNDRAYSLPMKDPKTSIDFDTAVNVCRNKGNGWHLHSNALWAAIQSWCYKNKTVPHGNSNYGKDYSDPHEKGTPSYINSNGNPYRISTGSGPVTWYHNYDSSGIADLCGNVWEWVSGLRILNGEIQIIPNGNVMKSDCNMSLTSTEWKAIMPDGSLVTPGTAGALKYDYINNSLVVNTSITKTVSATRAFSSLTAESGVNIPLIFKALGLFPISDYAYGNGTLYVDNNGERLPRRGANWGLTSDAGIAALNLYNSRAYSGLDIGFRSAFYE